jgi:pantothenate kinase-related protein Tda10
MDCIAIHDARGTGQDSSQKNSFFDTNTCDAIHIRSLVWIASGSFAAVTRWRLAANATAQAQVGKGSALYVILFHPSRRS